MTKKNKTKADARLEKKNKNQMIPNQENVESRPELLLKFTN